MLPQSYSMRAMVFESVGSPLRLVERALPHAAPGEVLLRVLACGVCRTDLHLVDGELSSPKLPLIPGHEVIGVVEEVGAGVVDLSVGMRVGVPWLGHSCGHCFFCTAGSENLCEAPIFTGYHRDGGYASHMLAEAAYCFRIDEEDGEASQIAPWLCAGLIGWRSLKAAGADSQRIGLYGFGAAAHLIAQIAIAQARKVYAFTRPGDRGTQDFARSLGVDWAGDSNETPPVLLDAAIIFAPAGELVPAALRAVRKGGRVVCGGIHMSDIPSFGYHLLWGERRVVSVANLTRDDGRDFFQAARQHRPRVFTTPYALELANGALADLRAGRITGAAVLVP